MEEMSTPAINDKNKTKPNENQLFIREKKMYTSYLFFLSDYLYRVESYHDGSSGSAKSEWILKRSAQGGKWRHSILYIPEFWVPPYPKHWRSGKPNTLKVN